MVAAMDAGVRERSQEYARKVFNDLFLDSHIEDRHDDFAKFKLKELTLGKVLGKGGFGTVSEIRGFYLEDEHESTEPPPKDSRHFLAHHCIRERGDHGGGDARYAVKVLSPNVIADAGLFIKGITDMAVETRILSSIEHPNLIKLRATASCDPFQPEYFIVMDRLYDTLEQRIKTWEKQLKRMSGFAGRLTDRKGEKSVALHEERLAAAYDLASAIDYLHECGIIYRDIKPENIGFDVRNDIKLFDFGLAKELKPSRKNEDGTYNLTGLTGSVRYMAPEVANSQPYNEKCDSYSFAILFWQILSCKIPYEMYTPKTLREKVYNGANKRPMIDESWKQSIKLLLRNAWDQNIHRRSNMGQITTMLKKEVLDGGGGEDQLEHIRRRSTFVFRQNNDDNVSNGNGKALGRGLSDISTGGSATGDTCI